MTHRDHNYAGETFFFQAKFCIHDRRIETFDRHRIQTHRRHAQQEVTDVQVHLFCHPVVVIFQLFAMHVGKEGAAFVVCGFGFRGGETAIALFLIHHALQPGIVHRRFGAEHHDVGSIQHFTFVEYKTAGCGFRHARFTFVSAGNDKVPRLRVGAGRTKLQQRF